jgi:hypothetical protein
VHRFSTGPRRVSGLASPTGEILVDVPNYFAAFNGLASSGLSDVIVSIKRQLFTERRSFSLSATAGFGFPAGRSGDGGHFYTPYVQFPWSLAISDDWSLNGMFTVTRPVAHAAAKATVEPTLVVETGVWVEGRSLR